MAITIHCDCGAKLQVKDEYAGQEGRCPKCGNTIQIPHPARPVADDDPGPATYQVVEETEEAPRRKKEPEREFDLDVGGKGGDSRRERRERGGDPDQGDVTDHGGEPIPAWMDFFEDPPEKIGPIMSACSDLRKGQEPWSAGARAGVTLFVGAIGMVIGLMITLGFGIREAFWAAFWPILLTVILAAIAFLCTGFAHTVTYVGRLGVARYGCTGNRDNVSSKESFLFADAIDLRTKTVLHYTNGAYQHTNYTYTWNDINGNTRFTITGQHNSEAGNPPTHHAFHFARASEIAWTLFLLEDAYNKVRSNGSIQFNLAGGDWIKVFDDGLKIKVGGVKEEWSLKEIRSVTVNAGTVEIRHREAQEGWFSSSGVVKFQYDQLANAQLFFHVLEKIGVSING